ncbi:MAG: response regulator [Anaerolineae bacterium]|nr:response regulator [Anaerolineae bacterium]MDQ7037049.1 response regulator [Anaerolineae bacterium]
MVRALIIDDNEDNVGVLEQLLALEGVDYTSVHDPAKLDKSIAATSSFDVIFLDLEMPNMDGFQMLNKMKADSRFSHTPIVAYTVHVSEINEARNQGFDSFIGKPLDADSFPKQLQQILSGEPVWANP